MCFEILDVSATRCNGTDTLVLRCVGSGVIGLMRQTGDVMKMKSGKGSKTVLECKETTGDWSVQSQFSKHQKWCGPYLSVQMMG
jgi:hypothetical protein